MLHSRQGNVLNALPFVCVHPVAPSSNLLLIKHFGMYSVVVVVVVAVVVVVSDTVVVVVVVDVSVMEVVEVLVVAWNSTFRCNFSNALLIRS